MLSNYLKIAFRNIRSNFSYSFINIFGLGIGLASAIIIGLWVHQETTYDEHFENADRIVRVGVSFANIGAMAPGPERFNEVVGQYPEVEQTASLAQLGKETITVGRRVFEETNIFYADSSYFDVFSYHFLEGSASSALNTSNTVVITEEIAQKYFSNSSAVGETIELGNDNIPYTVVGVISKRGRSHIPAEVFLYYEPAENTSWLSAKYYNYVLLREGVSYEEFEQRLNLLVKNRVFPTLNISQPYEEFLKSSAAYKFHPIPITDIYLRSDMRFDMNTGGDEANVYIFAVVALFIVIIAAVNFINITTARSSNRAKEVGIRKTLGGGQSSLVGQFLAESVITSLIALVVALGMAELFLAIFEQYTGIELLNTLFEGAGRLAVITGITVLIGILAGFYPAFYLSSFRPASVLKGDIALSRNSIFRNGLVVVQFTIAIGLLSCTGLVYQQLQFMQTKDMGLNIKDVLVVRNAELIGDHKDSFKQQLLDQAGVESASYNVRTPGSTDVWIETFRTPEMEEGYFMESFKGDYDFISTMGFRLLKGRNFSRNVTGDTAAVILNEKAVKKLMLEDPIGARLNDNLRVIGVVSDFNFESLRNPIEPVAIRLAQDERDLLAARIHTSDISGLLARIRDIWQGYNIEDPIDYYFMDQSYATMVSEEKALARAILLFSVLAVIISCLGLYGLSAYICELRTKEIGIRKVLGATIPDVIVRLTKDFTKPVLIAIVLAVPVAYVIISSWLDNFAYKISIGPWIFIAACLGGLAIAWLTVSGQSLKTALQNPVDSLRSE